MTSFLVKIKSLVKPIFSFYPILIIIAIPVLLIINTFWNLRSFNRDVNFFIRHNAVSLASSVSFFLEENLSDSEKASQVLFSMVEANDDLISASILLKEGQQFVIVASSDPLASSSEEVSQEVLNNFAVSLKEPFAGLSYDPKLAQNVWNVAVPINDSHILSMKLSTQYLDSILSRTSRDSIVILSILVAITIALLVNHFIFYIKSLQAEKLEEIDKLKDEFISVASHELRAPVTALVGYLELLRGKIPKEALPAITSDLSTLNQLTNDLNTLINELLEVSRIEQGRIKISLSETDINTVISEVVRNMQPLANQKNLELSFVQKELPKISTDSERLKQIMNNLVSNAVKYTLQGKIDVTANQKDTFIYISVKDSGVGIPPEELQNLFSKFHRIKDEKTKEERGTGLGLWITKQLVEALGGKIYVQSIHGSGSSFTFTLPTPNLNA